MKHTLPESVSQGWDPQRKPDCKNLQSFSLLLFDSHNQGSYEAGRSGFYSIVIKIFSSCTQYGFNFLEVHSSKCQFSEIVYANSYRKNIYHILYLFWRHWCFISHK